MPAIRTLRVALLSLIIVTLGLVTVGGAAANETTIANVISNDGQFKEFNKALNGVQLNTLLQGNGPFTVFAATDAAFANLPAGTLSNVTLQKQALLHHIVSGKFTSQQLATAKSKKSALGQDLAFELAQGNLLINKNIKVVTKDIQASNGIIHVIDAVLLPPWVKIAGAAGDALSTDSVPGVVGPDGNALAATPVSGDGPTIVNITDQVVLAGAKRLGINIGKRDQYSAAQYIKNLIPNPGFESGEFGMIFIVGPGASNTRVQADNWQTNWNNDARRIGQLAGLWDGGQFEIVSGAAKGRSGTISKFTLEGGRNTFYLGGGGATPRQGDIIFVRKEVAGYEGDLNRFNQADASQKRPGSPGRQALRLSPTGGALHSYAVPMDSYGRDGDFSAGKLLHVRGNWHFEIWAKGNKAGDKLKIRFRRVGESTFLNEEVALTTGWQRIQKNFSVDPQADAPKGSRPNAIFLELTAVGRGRSSG